MMNEGRLPGVRLPIRERADLARAAFALAERRKDSYAIARELKVSEPTARNLIAYGRRLAAGGAEKLEWR